MSAAEVVDSHAVLTATHISAAAAVVVSWHRLCWLLRVALVGLLVGMVMQCV